MKSRKSGREQRHADLLALPALHLAIEDVAADGAAEIGVEHVRHQLPHRLRLDDDAERGQEPLDRGDVGLGPAAGAVGREGHDVMAFVEEGERTGEIIRVAPWSRRTSRAAGIARSARQRAGSAPAPHVPSPVASGCRDNRTWHRRRARHRSPRPCRGRATSARRTPKAADEACRSTRSLATAARPRRSGARPGGRASPQSRSCDALR